MEWIILAIVVILVIAIISMYNGLVSARVKVDNAWSQIVHQFGSKHYLLLLLQIMLGAKLMYNYKEDLI